VSNQTGRSGAGMVTRRRVISRGLALGGAALWPAVFLTTRRAQANVGTRYDVSTKQGKKALDNLETAIDHMNKLPNTSPFSYFYQAGLHGVRYVDPGGSPTTDKDGIINTLFGLDEDKKIARSVWNTCVNHYGSSLAVRQSLRDWFLPWHRMYLYYFERIVRHVLQDPTFMLPYWNWSDPDQRALPKPFRNQASPLYNASRFKGQNKGEANIESGEPFDKFFEVDPVCATTGAAS
jgi:tyrosinase